MNVEHVYVDSELCRTCGGKCCKKSGCGFLPKDFKSLSYNNLLKKLEEGNISISALISFTEIKDKMYWAPILVLKIRNKDRDKTKFSKITDYKRAARTIFK